MKGGMWSLIEPENLHFEYEYEIHMRWANGYGLNLDLVAELVLMVRFIL